MQSSLGEEEQGKREALQCPLWYVAALTAMPPFLATPAWSRGRLSSTPLSLVKVPFANFQNGLWKSNSLEIVPRPPRTIADWQHARSGSCAWCAYLALPSMASLYCNNQCFITINSHTNPLEQAQFMLQLFAWPFPAWLLPSLTIYIGCHLGNVSDRGEWKCSLFT